MSEVVHVPQLLSAKPCGPRNCAAASGAMAIAYGGGPQLTAKQVRDESNVSCTPGVDTVSGGLRALDVRRVGLNHGVEIVYGNPPETLTSWWIGELEQRLREGEGSVVLGDAKVAPVKPTTGVVYHSAFVHGLDDQGRTHWHDPRLNSASWQPLAKVIRYWQEGAPPALFAGFVAPGGLPDTGTEPPTGGDMAGLKLTDWASFAGVIDIPKGAKAYPLDGSPAITLDAQTKSAYAGAYCASLNIRGWIVGDEGALIDQKVCKAHPSAGTPPASVTLGPGLYRVG